MYHKLQVFIILIFDIVYFYDMIMYKKLISRKNKIFFFMSKLMLFSTTLLLYTA